MALESAAAPTEKVADLVPPEAGTSRPPGTGPGAGRTQDLVRLILDTDFASLSAGVIHATKRVILDTIAVTAGTFDLPVAKALLRLKRDVGGRGDATLIFDGTKIPVSNAVFLHAQLGNLYDADETLLNRAHFACGVVSAALAVGEMVDASGQELIAAVATGFDVAARVGLSLQQWEIDPDGHVVYAPLFGWSWASFGAAAAAGRLLGLDHEQMARAIGQAYVMSPLTYDVAAANAPLYEFGKQPNWHRYQMSGLSAEAGVNAALLARDGFVAMTDVLDAGSAFWRSFCAVGCNFEFIYADLGRRWFIEETSMKRWPACRFGNTALDLFDDIVVQHDLAPGDITQISVTISPNEIMRLLTENIHIDDPLKLVMSLPTAFGLIAARIPPGPQWWADIGDEERRRTAAKVRCTVNAKWAGVLSEQVLADGFFRQVPTEVVVDTASGRYERYAEYAFGDPWAAGFEMSDEVLFDKVRAFCGAFLPAPTIEKLIGSVMSLDRDADARAVAASMVK
jgi:2-methylcitrate dehydratase PrpD